MARTTFTTFDLSSQVPNSIFHLSQDSQMTLVNECQFQECRRKCQSNKVLRTTANMIHELLSNMIKAIKILQGHKVTTKKQRMQKKMPKQQSTAHNSKHDTWTLVEYDKSHQNIAGTQGNYEKNKECRRKCQSNKVLRTTAKMIHELLSNMIKVIKRLRARRMIRLPPERYDLNRPLVSVYPFLPPSLDVEDLHLRSLLEAKLGQPLWTRDFSSDLQNPYTTVLGGSSQMVSG